MEVSLSSSMVEALNLSSNLLTISSLQITSLIFPTDAVAPPPVRSRRTRTSSSRTLLKRRRRTRRKSPPSEGEGDGVFFGGGDDGGFIGGFGGGRGWNFGGDGGGGFNWNNDDSSPSCPDDPAFDFVYEVICWIVFSNCLHFAFKKVLRLVTEDREKDPIASVC